MGCTSSMPKSKIKLAPTQSSDLLSMLNINEGEVKEKYKIEADGMPYYVIVTCKY